MDKLILINEIFSADSEISIIIPFNESVDYYTGEISLSVPELDPLHFNVEIPKSYPLSDSDISVKFKVKEEIIAPHVNGDKSICILTPQHHDFEHRLKWEILFLKAWRDKYYLQHEINGEYDYLVTPYSNASCYLFTNISHKFKKGDFGEFKYSVFSDLTLPNSQTEADQAYILSIGGFKCDWSENILNRKASKGFYVFIEEEPIHKPFSIVTDWVELKRFLPKDFLQTLYDYKSRKQIPHTLKILIGYSIPNPGKNDECHWQILTVKNSEIPISGLKIGPKQYLPHCYEHPIEWSKTINSDYSRFFGRGSLSNRFIQKKILIIGVGAIGSALATILVRSGIRKIEISDSDIIEPGNVCRSEYLIFENQLPKVVALKNHLISISPFVNVGLRENISKKDYGKWTIETKNYFEDYDLIFDCTSDNELSFFIDKLKIGSRVINISVSNDATEMVLVTGENITKTKKIIFDNFKAHNSHLIFEGTGCWSPTFKASYFDIQSQLNLLVQNMNFQIEQTGTIRTTVIKREQIDRNITLKVIDY